MDMTLCEKYLITNEGSEHLSPKDVFIQILNEQDKDVKAAYAAVVAWDFALSAVDSRVYRQEVIKLTKSLAAKHLK